MQIIKKKKEIAQLGIFDQFIRSNLKQLLQFRSCMTDLTEYNKKRFTSRWTKITASQSSKGYAI